MGTCLLAKRANMNLSLLRLGLLARYYSTHPHFTLLRHTPGIKKFKFFASFACHTFVLSARWGNYVEINPCPTHSCSRTASKQLPHICQHQVSQPGIPGATGPLGSDKENVASERESSRANPFKKTNLARGTVDEHCGLRCTFVVHR